MEMTISTVAWRPLAGKLFGRVVNPVLTLGTFGNTVFLLDTPGSMCRISLGVRRTTGLSPGHRLARVPAGGMPAALIGPTPHRMGAANKFITVQDYLDTVRGRPLSALEFLSQETSLLSEERDHP